jgi:hypothetical protein
LNNDFDCTQMATSLTADDPSYLATFGAAKDTIESADQMEGNLTPHMNALRAQAPVMRGSLRSL